MNKKLTIASALLAASAAFAFETWNGADEGSYRVLTELDNGTETSGYWFSYNDKADGGASTVAWPVEPGTTYGGPNALDPIIDACKGVCGTAALDKGTLTYPPFIGIGFNIYGANADDDSKADPADASAWGGLCITYTSDIKPALELGLGDMDATIEYANPYMELPKATSPVTRSIPWSSFKQPTWYSGKTKVSGDEASTQLVAVKFKLQSNPGNYKFNICAIGPATGGACPTTCETTTIKSVRGASSVKALLSGRTLSFSGVKSNATAEVMNLQGQVVAKGDASSAMNLAALDAGVYMVRVAGKSVNFTNKIVLK
ncbi:MAG: T9SS type A sorting domain-containing protein [Fibrobacter sp.]|uniref:T9SS type A sorting domain-containing protein n=1 Tax=Fibrobacter sp. TaxID=35828 RepID=UPI0025C6DF7A|nr:T9SS type A sorting domain-containing protein [Fibrobacter sp.]MBQ7081365.1 T9SS type A sorting domain-containing protein [Fibrobacter sp.]